MDSLRPMVGSYKIDANRTVKDALEQAARRQHSRERISVTDLLNPAQAYFQRTRPDIEIPLERLQLMWTGTRFHNVFGAAVSSEELLEQFVEKDGVIGKIDIYEDVPTEVKTSGSLPEDLVAERGAYLEQLGMYCYMAGEPDGVVIVYRREEYGRPAGLRAYRVTFQDLDAIGQAMRHRRDLLEHALEAQEPASLPRCEWWKRNCIYQECCACASAETSKRVVDAESLQVNEDSQLTADLLAAAAQWRNRPSWAISLNDLVFPRWGTLRRTVDTDEDEERENLADMQKSGFYRALIDALRYGEPGGYSGVSVAIETVRGLVRSHQGTPTIIRTTGTYRMIERDFIYEERPYWLDRLALEVALTNQTTGRLVAYYPRLDGGDKFMVYDFHFGDLTGTLEEARRRIQLFAEKSPPSAFPRCEPEWMLGYCPFKANCVCKQAG